MQTPQKLGCELQRETWDLCRRINHVDMVFLPCIDNDLYRACKIELCGLAKLELLNGVSNLIMIVKGAYKEKWFK